MDISGVQLQPEQRLRNKDGKFKVSLGYCGGPYKNMYLNT